MTHAIGDQGSCLLLSGTFVVDAEMRIDRVLERSSDLPARIRRRQRVLDALSPALEPQYGSITVPDKTSRLAPGQAAVDVDQSWTSRVDDVLAWAEYVDPLPPGIGSVQLVVGNLGAAALWVRPEDERCTASELEAIAGAWVSQEVERLSVALGVALVRADLAQQRPSQLISAGTLLWWDRIIATGSASGPLQVGTTEVDLRGHVCDVGYAMSFVRGPVELIPADLPAQIARGIFMAAEDWLVADSVNRMLSEFLVVASQDARSKRGRALAEAAELGRVLSIRAQLLRLYMDERDRYLSLTERAVWVTARQVWGLDGELALLDSRTRAVHEQIAQVTSARQRLVDSARNTALYLIAILTVVQSGVLAAEFYFGDDTEASSDFHRSVGVTVGLAAAFVLLIAVAFPIIANRSREAATWAKRNPPQSSG